MKDRFLNKVDKRGPIQKGLRRLGRCWNWTGCLSAKGYGRFCTPNGIKFAHRVSYELFVGKIPKALELDHLCRNKRCIRPSHLEPKTHKENMRAPGSLVGLVTGAKKKARTHCCHGHLYTKETTYVYRGSRQCKTCTAIRLAEIKKTKGRVSIRVTSAN